MQSSVILYSAVVNCCYIICVHVLTFDRQNHVIRPTLILLVMCYDDVVTVKCGTSSPQRFQFVSVGDTNLA